MPFRVRYYTDAATQASIKASKVIEPTLRAGQEGVHVADAAHDAGMGALVGASKTGRYVEFDAPADLVETTMWNNNYGIPTYRIPTTVDYDIRGLNPNFGPWWKL